MFKPDAVVVACNTASTIALAALRATYKTPFIGCVPPIKPAAAASTTKHIGLLATPATIRRPYLQNLIDTYAADCRIHSLGTPTLANLAEAKFRGEMYDLAELATATAPLFAQADAGLIDVIALGCTHYTFLLPELQTLHPAIQFFDPAGPVARQTLTVTQALPTEPAMNAAYFTAALPNAEAMAARLAVYAFPVIQIF
jgi:glutamate racemase